MDVVGCVAGSTAVAEDRIAGDSDGLNSKLFENAFSALVPPTPTPLFVP